MKEHYVSYEQGQALKRLGFDERTTYEYIEIVDGTAREEWDEDEQRILLIEDINYYPKLRLDQAAAWLREVKNVIVCPFPERYKEYVVQGIYRERLSGWDYEIWVDEEEYSEPKFGYIESYEKALELGISKALELLGKEAME